MRSQLQYLIQTYCACPKCPCINQKVVLVQVGVEKVTLSGRVRITMKPLMDEMPIVAAMQV